MAPPELSVVVPLYNEEESLRPLYGAITRAVAPLGISFEIVFVDDGSRDATVRIADEIARVDPRVVLVKFRRNYGQTPAMAAGIAQVM
jgi:glycosyltransferase involved in cell wall biosynthesis